MEAIANLIIATAGLVEAEGRAFRRHLIRLTVAAVLVLSASLIGLFGIGFLLYGFFLFLAEHVSQPAAAVMFGIAALLIAGGTTWIARRLIG
ncbi:MAG: hypothetical protein H7144_06900 [Burkholderiales bacterium]|nr:hypothetical protein [Phycisphaerae bacterium]